MIGVIIASAVALGAFTYARRRRYWYNKMRWAQEHGFDGEFDGAGGCHGGRYGFDGPDPRGRGRHRGYGRHGHHGRRRRGFGGLGGFGPRRFVEMLSYRLDATPAQEKVMREAAREVWKVAREQREELSDSRTDLGKAMGGERFDEQVLGELFARHDERLRTVRQTVVGALAKVHDALDTEQREELARWLGASGRRFGPYRA